MSNTNIKNSDCKNDFVDIVLLITGAFFAVMTVLSTVVAGYGLFYQLPSWLPFAKPTVAEFVLGLAGSLLALALMFFMGMLAFDKKR